MLWENKSTKTSYPWESRRLYACLYACSGKTYDNAKLRPLANFEAVCRQESKRKAEL